MCLNCCKRVDGVLVVNAVDAVDAVDGAESPANLLTSVALLPLIFISLLKGETSHEQPVF